MSGRRVLVADDELVIRLLLQRLLVDRFEEVAVFETAAEACDAIAESPFDLVVTDIRMPGGGGSVARTARARGIPVIFITGFAEIGGVQELIDDGVPVVRKPFAPQRLFQVIDEVMSDGDPPTSPG